jgi:hypothetical protein
MVHALREIQRVLAPDGILIDLRPLDERWPVEVTSRRETRRIGRLLDSEQAIASDDASNEAMKRMARRAGSASDAILPLCWDTPGEMRVSKPNGSFNGLDEETLQAARSAWAVADADSRVRIRVKMLISRWRKTGAGVKLENLRP